MLHCDPEKEKVFGIGLSRTGTTSLHRALLTLGYRSAHWINPYTNHILGISDYYYFDAITDINTAAVFESLFFAFPNAKFIYTERDVEEWAASIAWHYDAETPKSVARRFHHIPVTERSAKGPPHERSSELHFIHHTLYLNHSTWVQAYEKHDYRVREFFRIHGRDRLLTLHLSHEKHPWERLCTFLDQNAPNIPFPNASWKRPQQTPAPGQIGFFAR